MDNIEELLENQFINGCDMLFCDNIYCRRSPNFQMKGYKKERLKEIAQMMAKNGRAEEYICPMQSALFCDKGCVSLLNKFKEWTNLIGKGTSVNDILQHITPVFSDIRVFSNIFIKENACPTFSDFAIDEDRLFQFSSIISSNLKLSTPLFDFISSLARSVLEYGDLYTITSLRAQFLLLYFPSILTPDSVDTLLLPFLDCFPNSDIRQIFIDNFAKYQTALNQFVGICHFAIQVQFARNPKMQFDNPVIRRILAAMKVGVLGNALSDTPLPSRVFYNHHIDQSVDEREKLNINDPIIQDPFALPLKSKASLCEFESQQIMEREAASSLFAGILSGRVSESDLFLTINVRRENIVDDASMQLAARPSQDLVKKLRVTFNGEDAIDAGGPSREFMYLISEQLFSPVYGMFNAVDNRYLWFNPASFEGTLSFRLCGIIVGLAIHNKILMPVRFPRALFKKILGFKTGLGDLREIDPELGSTLSQVLEIDDVSDLCLTFEATVDQFGEALSIPLIKDGANIEVTNDNREDFVRLYTDFILNSGIERQFGAFAQGFKTVCCAPTYSRLMPDELDSLLRGEDKLDWAALKRAAKYHGYRATSKVVGWFWEVFEALPEVEKLKLLKFVTGSDRAPLGGLGSIDFVIEKAGDHNMLPTAHTCFSTLVLPQYRSLKEMKEKLLLAIDNTDGFGFK